LSYAPFLWLVTLNLRNCEGSTNEDKMERCKKLRHEWYLKNFLGLDLMSYQGRRVIQSPSLLQDLYSILRVSAFTDLTMKVIDLSMPVHTGMVTFPRIAPPVISEIETHQQFALMMGVTMQKYGVDAVTNHCLISMGDHSGTHIDSLWHVDRNSSVKSDKIPIEYCMGDGVVLDFSWKKTGEEITDVDVEEALRRINYTLKPRDIVLIRTDSSRKYYDKPEYLREQPGMTRESTLWLIDAGVKVIGIDAATFDLPVHVMLKLGKIWPAHMVMKEREYYHIENLFNLDQIPVSHGFKFFCLPIRIVGASASPVRAVAVIE